MSKCPSCDCETYPEDAFCSQCGTRLGARSADTGLVRRTILKQTTATVDRLACGSCNGPLLAGEVFCATCGARYGPATSQPEQREIRTRILRKLEEATRGRFEFVREIGRGGMGAVYLARELELERNVAIKVLSSGWLTDGSMIERFRREAKTVASLRHPSIVHVHGVGRAEDIHYFIMDFIDGVSLGRILLTHGPLSIPVVLAILGQVGSALNYAHRPGRSVIHRDIKPGNIMVDAEGGSYLTDFGISKATETHSGLTMTGLIMGTPEYMSPEQCRGDAAGPASDQYALGAVAFAMLTGSPPFTGPHYRVLVGHTSEQPPRVSDLRPDCPEEIDDAVARMLAKVPNERWPDIAHAMKALGARPVLPDDPVRDELAGLVRSARGARRTAEQTPEVAAPIEPDAIPTWLRILSIPETLETGDAIDLRAVKGFEDGREIENGDVRWESTDPAIALIDPETGRLVAVGTGSATITASVADVRETVALEVRPARVAQLIVEPATLEIEVGDTKSFGAAARGRTGQPLDRPVLWSSSDPGVATIDDTGSVAAHRQGSASVLAHCEGVGASAAVNVVPATVTSVSFTVPPASIHTGSTVRLEAIARDARGARLDRPITFASSDKSVVTVRQDGTVEAVNAGTATVTATCDDHTASCELTVEPPPAAAIELSSPPSELIEGDTFHMMATPLDADGEQIDIAVDWRVADHAVIEPLGDGRFRAARAGATRVVAHAATTESSIELRVDPVRAVSLRLIEPPASIQVDEVVELAADVRDQRGRPMVGTTTWRTSDPWIARVNARGVLEGAGPGSATISAECGDLSDAFDIEVTAAPWATVVFQSGVAKTTEEPTTARPDEPTINSPDEPEPAPAAVPALDPDTGRTAKRVRPRGLAFMASVAVAGIAAIMWFALPDGPDTPPVEPLPLDEPVAASVSIVDANGNELPAGTVELTEGDTLRFGVLVATADGVAITDLPVQWATTDASIASVDAGGNLIALADGRVRVSATAGNVTDDIDLTIAAVAPPVAVADDPRPTRQTQPAQTVAPGSGEVEQSPPPVTETAPPPEPPPPGTFRMRVEPWANVTLNGDAHPNWTQNEMALQPGRYELRLEHPAMMTVDTTFEIRSGEVTTFAIILRPRG